MEIIASFNGQKAPDPLAALRHPPPGATMVELRADLFPPGFPLEQAVAASPLPVVLTLRSRAEGGSGPEDPQQRAEFFQRARHWPVAFFDLEAARDGSCLGQVVPKEKVILSCHLATGAGQELERTMAQLLAAGTRWAKLVVGASGLADVLQVLRLAQALSRGANGQRRGIVFAQGEQGLVTRLLGPFLAAPVVYASWGPGQEVAAGQLTPSQWQALMGHLSGRPKKVFAVLGSQVHRSLSPRMHNAAFRALGLPHAFVPLSVTREEELALLLQPAGAGPLEACGLPVGGFAVTMPWKEKAALACQVLAPRAERAGAVNTVLPRPGKLVGDLTDVDGLHRVLLEAGVRLPGALVGVLGTGGAARAALVMLHLAGAQGVLVARNPAKGQALAQEFGARLAKPQELGEVQAFINASPAGADGGEDGLLAALSLPAGCPVVDMPYGETPTFLQLLAQERGWDYVSGKEVLLYQGVSQFAAMNGVAPPVRAMAQALGLEEVQG